MGGKLLAVTRYHESNVTNVPAELMKSLNEHLQSLLGVYSPQV